MRAFIACMLLVAGAATPSVAVAADFYVAATGSPDGDGTKEKPFDDPQRAIDKAAAGDVIHVAQGVYHGKLKCGYLVIDKLGITLAGGYKDATFAERNPFLYPTQIKESPEARGTSFAGPYIRIGDDKGSIDTRGTTIDGFWFDRKDQNLYDKQDNLRATSSNMKPVLELEHADSHIRNCVIANTALYGLRVNGDGSSVENCAFINNNYCALDVYGKGQRLEKGYQFNKILIARNTFFSCWNCESLEEAAGNFITNNGNADLDVRENIFTLSNGNNPENFALMGWAIKDVKNFKGDKWTSLTKNSFSFLRGGIMIFYATAQKATMGIWKDVAELRDAPLGANEGNDTEPPLFETDPEWLKRYSAVVAREDPNKCRVKMDDWNKLRRIMKLPLEGEPPKPGWHLGTPYPIEHVKTGAFWKPTNEKVAGRGVKADGEFPVTPAKLAAGSASDTVKRDYEAIEWDALWEKGVELVDKPIKVKCYYDKFDPTYGSGVGKKQVAFLEGATDKTHKILALREVPEIDKGGGTLKGYVKLGSAALDYVQKNAPRPGGRGECNFSFVVHGVVKKAGAKIGGKVPEIVIEIDSITAN